MLHETSRARDIVEVINKDSDYYGTIGKLLHDARDSLDGTMKVDIYGTVVSFNRSELKLRARVGTRTHDDLQNKILEAIPSNLTKEDYNDLINFALDIGDKEWSRELVKRKYEAVK